MRLSTRRIPGWRCLLNAHGLGLAAAYLLAVGAASPSQAQLSLPQSETGLPFNNTGDEFSFVIDLGSLPTRPLLVAEATPDPGHPDLQIELEIKDFSPGIAGHAGICPVPTDSRVSSGAPGAASLLADFWRCDPGPDAFVGESARVIVRVLNFGSSAAPATLDIVIRGQTQVPTNTLTLPYAPTAAAQAMTLHPSKDTTIYEPGTTSNGGGDFLWSGTRSGTTPGGLLIGMENRALLAFHFPEFIPATASIEATLQLDVVGLRGVGNGVALYRVAPDAGVPPVSWKEGGAHALNDEFVGSGSDGRREASWPYRQYHSSCCFPSSSVAWSIAPGGDPVGPFWDPLASPLVSQNISTTGLAFFSSTAFTAAVADMIATGNEQDGFLLTRTAYTTSESGVQFASRDNTTGDTIPTLHLSFTPAEPIQLGTLVTGTLETFDEGENFRWVGDLGADNIVTTSVGGVCEAYPEDGVPATNVSYRYDFMGAPGFTGVDCCAWKIDSTQSGTVGVGQLAFFHNLDPNDPANMPLDTDADGIFDLCDNCVDAPNGPGLGTCVHGPFEGDTCHADSECFTGFCSLSQEDENEDASGDACNLVPEPGFTTMLASGMMFLVATARGRRSSTRRTST